MVLVTASCTMLWTSFHSSLELCLSDLIPWIYLSLPLYNHKGFDLGHTWMNGLVVFPTFFNLSLNFSVRSSWSEPQSAPGFVFTHCIGLLHLQGYKECNQSDFGIGHLVMSMCRVIAWVVGKECLLWSACSLHKTVILFPASFCTVRQNLLVILGISWLPTFAFKSLMMKKHLFLVLV